MRLVQILGPVAAVALAACAASPGAGIDAGKNESTSDVAEAPPQADSSELAQSRIDAIVAEIMDQQYGKTLDEVGQCWEYTYSENGAEDDYCMQPAKADVVKTSSGYNLYLRASNNPETGEGYEAITPGLMGAFQVAVDRDGKWRYVAKSPALPFGTMGYCGCDKAAFVRLGSEYYGWMFTSGGTWQGITVANHEIVAPHGDMFADVSEVPEIKEDSPDVSYSIEVVAGSGEIFPLKVIRVVSGHRDGERIVAFDKAHWAYRMPETF